MMRGGGHRALVAGAVLIAALGWGGLAAQEALEKRLHWWERALIPLDPEVEKALALFAEKMAPYRRKDLEDHMQAIVSGLATRQSLTADVRKQLDDAAAKAVEETMKSWVPRVTETNRVRLAVTEREAALQIIASWEPNTEGIGQNRLVKNFPLPETQAVFATALKAVLTPAQLGAWEAGQEAALKEREADAKKYLRLWESRGRERAEKWLASEMDEMKTKLGLDDARAEKLRTTGAELVKSLADENVRHVMDTLRCATPPRLRQLAAREGTFRALEMEAMPEGEPRWQEAVASALTPREKEKWAAILAERQKRREGDIKDYVEKMMPQWQPSFEQRMKFHLGAVKAELALDEARAKQLEAASNEAVKVTMETWKLKTAKLLRALGQDQFDAALAGRSNYFAPLEEEEGPMYQAPWKKGFESILTPEERQRWQTAQVERAERDKRALLLVAVFELDKRLALSTQQRQRLEAVLAKVAGEFTKGRAESTYWNINLDSLYTTAKRANPDEVRSILDDKQWQRWQTLQVPGSRIRAGRSAVKSDSGSKPDALDMEAAISRFLHERSLDQRDLLSDTMQVKYEDAVRVTGLQGDPAKRLATAAKGAVENALRGWRGDMDSYVRGNLQGATPEGIEQRLDGMGGVTFGRRQAPETLHPWQDTLATVLDEKQRAAWQKQVDERHAYMESAMALFVVAELDRRYRLTKAQHDTLSPRIAAIIREYLPDIEQEFSYYRDSWHLQSYYVLTPLAGIPEADLKSILSAEQWTQFQERDLPNAMSRWNDVKQYHDRRKSAEPKPAAGAKK